MLQHNSIRGTNVKNFGQSRDLQENLSSDPSPSHAELSEGSSLH